MVNGGTPPHGGNREDLEKQWRHRLEDASLQLDMARNYVREIQADQKTGLIASSQGKYARQHARRAEEWALRHYRDVLKIYTDLFPDSRLAKAAGE